MRRRAPLVVRLLAAGFVLVSVAAAPAGSAAAAANPDVGNPTDRVVISALTSRSPVLTATSPSTLQARAGAVDSAAAPRVTGVGAVVQPAISSLTSVASPALLTQAPAPSVAGPAPSVLLPAAATAAQVPASPSTAVSAQPGRPHYPSAFILPLVLLVAVGFFGHALTSEPDVEPITIDTWEAT